MDASEHGAEVGNQVNLARMKQLLILHEGLKLKPYRCTAGKLTVGVGYNIEAHGVPFGMTLQQIIRNGITEEQAMTLLANGIADCIHDLSTAFPWWDGLDEIRRRVLIDMRFNLGMDRLNQFKVTLAHISAGRYEQAAAEMLKSKWAVQVGGRAQRLSRMMRTGKEAA